MMSAETAQKDNFKLLDEYNSNAAPWPSRVLLPAVSRIYSRLTSRFFFRIMLVICFTPLFLYMFVPSRHLKSSYALVKGDPPAPRNAFAVLLAENSKTGVDQSDMDADAYFQATRVLNYQIKHSINTRYTNDEADFIALVTPEVAQNKRDQLEREGATVIAVDNLHVDWISKGVKHGPWRSVLTKLKLWTLTQYDRILCIDSDTMLLHSLDGVFDDDAAQEHKTNFSLATNTSTHMPSSYIFGGIKEGISGNRAKPVNAGYLNAGFFMLRPDLEMYNYYMELMSVPNLFNPSMPEQNLFNHAHAQRGPMPWQRLDETWNTNCPNFGDYLLGWKTVHGKHWQLNFREKSKGEKGRCDVDPVYGTTWWRTRGHMESFYAKKAM